MEIPHRQSRHLASAAVSNGKPTTSQIGREQRMHFRGVLKKAIIAAGRMCCTPQGITTAAGQETRESLLFSYVLDGEAYDATALRLRRKGCKISALSTK